MVHSSKYFSPRTCRFGRASLVVTHLPNFLKMSFWGMHFQSEIGSLVLENKKIENFKEKHGYGV